MLAELAERLEERGAHRPVDDAVTATAESSDVPIAEKQLDDNGDEVYLIYRTTDDMAGRSQPSGSGNSGATGGSSGDGAES